MSKSEIDPFDLAAILTKTCAEQGMDTKKAGAFLRALYAVKANATPDDWKQALRLLSPDAREEATHSSPFQSEEWTRPSKLDRNEAFDVLIRRLPEIEPFLDDESREILPATIEEIKGTLFERARYAVQILSWVRIVHHPDNPAFQLVGTLLHAVASTGNRQGMWMLATYLRIYAAQAGDDPARVRELNQTAQLWEMLGLSVRRFDTRATWEEAIPLCDFDRWNNADRHMATLKGSLRIMTRDWAYRMPSLPADQPEASGPDATPGHTTPGKVTLIETFGGAAANDTGGKLAAWRSLLSPLPVLGRFDPDETYTVLRREFPWMEEANVAVAEMVAGLRAGRSRFSPILLTGEPGIGKTTWACRLAELCQLPNMVASAGSGVTSILIAGSERGWKDGSPSLPAKVARDKQAANPMIILDEVDKAASMASHANAASVYDALLAILDAGDKGTYYDIFLEGCLDLSRFSWVLLANSLDRLPAPLLDRLTILEARRPRLDEVERGFDAMAASWLPGETITPDLKRKALARFEETRSLRDLRLAVQRGSLQTLWQPPGPHAIDP